MRWGMEPSTPPARRSATKRLSSDYGKRLCQRLWGAHGLIEIPSRTRAKTESKPARKRCRIPARPPGRVLLWLPDGTSAGVRAVYETAQCARHHRARQTGAGRAKTRLPYQMYARCKNRPERTITALWAVACILPARLAWRGYAHGARERAQTGREGAGRTSGRECMPPGAPGGPWGDLGRIPRSGIEKSPGRIRGDALGADYLKRRAALKSTISGSSRMKSRCTVITSNAIVSHPDGVVKRLRGRRETRGGENGRGAGHRCTMARAGHLCRCS